MYFIFYGGNVRTESRLNTKSTLVSFVWYTVSVEIAKEMTIMVNVLHVII